MTDGRRIRRSRVNLRAIPTGARSRGEPTSPRVRGVHFPEPLDSVLDTILSRPRRAPGVRGAPRVEYWQKEGEKTRPAMIPHHPADSDSSSASPRSAAVDRVPHKDRRKSARRTHRLSVKPLATQPGDAVPHGAHGKPIARGSLHRDPRYVRDRKPRRFDHRFAATKDSSVRGRVCWRRASPMETGIAPGVGIRFERVSNEDADRIREFAKA